MLALHIVAHLNMRDVDCRLVCANKDFSGIWHETQRQKLQMFLSVTLLNTVIIM
jgi:hypothetical protein